ncbi:sigma-70 family RNA polymerase sigma factor [Caryophanon latum]|uniref:RNA polymerase factor sigma C n=1 Tax=Caryophanon latum TaxID=33977 RepID=A0A1C0YPC6_9BACL|nr:sigma-70 family RNA polymerase sigma factor [Caryophanon latum]OCS89024.1 RNA polymerase factor sigma C [Caryophanon latum]
MSEQEKDALLERVMIAYGDELVRLAYTYVKESEVAKDVVQNAFVKCYRHLDTFRGDANIKTWLYRITMNESKDYLKSWHCRMVRVKSFFHENSARQQSAEKEVLHRFAHAQLKADIFTLPTMYREVVYLHYFEDLAVAEIAELLHASPHTIKTRLRRGTQRLGAILKEEHT